MLKKLSLQNTITSLFKRKRFIDFLRSKQLLRSSITQEKIGVLENYSNFIPITYTNTLNQGTSILGKKIVGKHRFSNDWSIDYFIQDQHNSQANSLFFLSSFFLGKYKNSRSSAFILKNKKGGYNIYCRGVIGFLPRSQLRIFFKDLYKKFLSSQKKEKRSEYLSFFSFFLSFNHKLRKYGFFRLPLYLTNGMRFRPYYSPKHFSQSNNIKKFRGSVNSVFVYEVKEKV